MTAPIRDPSKIALKEIPYLRIEPIDPGIRGLYQVHHGIRVTNLNKEDLTESKLEAADTYFTLFHAEMKNYIQQHASFLAGTFLDKLNTYQEEYKDLFFSQLVQTPARIQEYLDQTTNIRFANPLINYDVILELNFWFTKEKFDSSYCRIITHRSTGLTTPIWTQPTKHMFERNNDVYRRSLRFTGR